MNIINIILQAAVIIILSPLVTGIITKIKNNFRFRQGPTLFQPYFNLAKYFCKEEIISEHASWIFRATPFIVFASIVTATALLPPLFSTGTNQYIGDFIALIFLLSLGRFFLALAGLDPATTFGGMGASREMFIASFVEPVALLAVFAVSLTAGTTNPGAITTTPMTSSLFIAAMALFLVTLVETARLPIDNQETHLELTMIHEAMLLEYSGKSLGLLELSACIKQAIFFLIISFLVLPGLLSPIFLLGKILLLSITVAMVEVALAKMRLFRVVDFLSFAGILSILAVLSLVFGV